MLANIRQPVRQLPLIPMELLKRHDAYEKFDTRFRSCARLLQSLWRDAQGLPVGKKTPPRTGKRRLGSRLATAAADEGRNFLSPAVAELASLEVTYQERGALIDRQRLEANLLSSMPLAFNVAGPWRLDMELAANILRRLLPQIDISTVVHVWFEHSPNRLDRAFTGDRTALDIAVVYERSDGERGFIGFEVKYSEDATAAGTLECPSRLDELAHASNLFKDPRHAALRVRPLQQLFREHLLCYAGIEQKLYREAHFVLLSPRHNDRIERMGRLYSAFLAPPSEGCVPFHQIELEAVIGAFAAAGEEHYATLLFERYCDWSRLDRLIESEVIRKHRDWTVAPLNRAAPLALIAQAA